MVFRWPGDRSQVWVKRVIGLPGDHIGLRRGQVWIDGEPVAFEPAGIGRDGNRGWPHDAGRALHRDTARRIRASDLQDDHTRAEYDDMPDVVVPPGHLFVMGDNRDNSADSRVPVRAGGVGLLPVEDLVGRVDAIVGSWDLAVKSRPI